MDERALEDELKAKGLTAPRVTPDQVTDAIWSEAYYRFPGTTLTVCALTLKNGFVVTGESAAASFANYDPDIGRRLAFDDARKKIWAYEGYRLHSELARAASQGTSAGAPDPLGR